MTRLEKISAALRDHGWDAALIVGGENLCYATGFVGLEGMVFITKDGRGFCHTDSRYIEAAETQIAPLGYEVRMPDGPYSQAAAALVREYGTERLAFEDRVVPVSEYEKYKNDVFCALIPAGDMYEVLREVKEEEEITHIVAAQRIAEKALHELLPRLKPGAVEQELAAELNYLMEKKRKHRRIFPDDTGLRPEVQHAAWRSWRQEIGEWRFCHHRLRCDGRRLSQRHDAHLCHRMRHR